MRYTRYAADGIGKTTHAMKASMAGKGDKGYKGGYKGGFLATLA